MKIKLLFWIVCAFFMAGCSSSKHFEVETDYSYQGKFKRYKSFNFLDDNALKEYFTDAQRKSIEDEVKFRMQLLGYKFTDKRPNLLVSYRVFFNDLKFIGYKQPEIETWAKDENEEEKYDAIKYKLREGTLLVTMIDFKQEKAVWQGYASSVFGNELYNNEKQLRRAVRLIFDKYRFLAEGFEFEEKGK